jgi:hypothetical protein
VPICNGVCFQSGVSNLAYGGGTMSEFLNSFISRGHVNYINDIEQFLVRWIKEKSTYTSLNYQDELNKNQNDKAKQNTEVPRNHIDDGARYKERRDPTRATG